MARRGRGTAAPRNGKIAPNGADGTPDGAQHGDEPGARTMAAIALKRWAGRGSGGSEAADESVEAYLAGPYDEDDVDPEHGEVARVDFGAVRLPVPRGGQVTVEPEEGRLQAVHVVLPAGRLSVSALAAPRTGRLWPDLAAEIDESLREGGATVRSFTGEWGRELHARTGEASSVFVGVDGPRWMLYGVATGPTACAADLDAALRTMLRGTVVARGRSPYPVRTVLPLTVPEQLLTADTQVAVAPALPARPGAGRGPRPALPAGRGGRPSGSFRTPPSPPPPRVPPAPPVDAPTELRPVPPLPPAPDHRDTRDDGRLAGNAAAYPGHDPGPEVAPDETAVVPRRGGLFRTGRRPAAARDERPAVRQQRRVSDLLAEAERDRTAVRETPRSESVPAKPTASTASAESAGSTASRSAPPPVPPAPPGRPAPRALPPAVSDDTHVRPFDGPSARPAGPPVDDPGRRGERHAEVGPRNGWYPADGDDVRNGWRPAPADDARNGWRPSASADDAGNGRYPPSTDHVRNGRPATWDHDDAYGRSGAADDRDHRWAGSAGGARNGWHPAADDVSDGWSPTPARDHRPASSRPWSANAAPPWETGLPADRDLDLRGTDAATSSPGDRLDDRPWESYLDRSPSDRADAAPVHRPQLTGPPADGSDDWTLPLPVVRAEPEPEPEPEPPPAEPRRRQARYRDRVEEAAERQHDLGYADRYGADPDDRPSGRSHRADRDLAARSRPDAARTARDDDRSTRRRSDAGAHAREEAGYDTGGARRSRRYDDRDRPDAHGTYGEYGARGRSDGDNGYSAYSPSGGSDGYGDHAPRGRRADRRRADFDGTSAHDAVSGSHRADERRYRADRNPSGRHSRPER